MNKRVQFSLASLLLLIAVAAVISGALFQFPTSEEASLRTFIASNGFDAYSELEIFDHIVVRSTKSGETSTLALARVRETDHHSLVAFWDRRSVGNVPPWEVAGYNDPFEVGRVDFCKKLSRAPSKTDVVEFRSIIVAYLDDRVRRRVCTYSTTWK